MGTLDIVESVEDLRRTVASARGAGPAAVGFVPTMGALHDGHAELIRRARSACDVVVVSCYVNPLQFGPAEDLDRYPRTPDEDARIVLEAGGDVLWRPTDTTMYAGGLGDAVVVRTGRIGDVLEGASRPGHFDGVATIVAKLLAAVAPDVLYLGEKDFQQLAVVRKIVSELLLPVEVRGVPIVREPDGLARSSRNAYLAPEEREAAVSLSRALHAASASVEAGVRDPGAVVAAATDVLDGAGPLVRSDYVALVHPDTLEPLERIGDAAVLLLAARVGSTRLIDNLRLLPRDHHATRTEVQP